MIITLLKSPRKVAPSRWSISGVAPVLERPAADGFDKSVDAIHQIAIRGKTMLTMMEKLATEERDLPAADAVPAPLTPLPSRGAGGGARAGRRRSGAFPSSFRRVDRLRRERWTGRQARLDHIRDRRIARCNPSRGR